MINAIIFKEYIKTKKIIFIFFFLILCSLFNTFIDAKNAHEFSEATTAILSISQMQRFSFNFLKEVLILFSIAFAIAQYYPEISSARIRLFLHLPMSHFKLIFILIFSSLSFFALVFAFITFIYFSILNTYYPFEIFEAIFSKLLPMFLTSILVYLTCALMFVEVKVIKKIFYAFLSCFVVYLYLSKTQSTYFASFELNILMFILIIIYIINIYEVFTSYTKGYIK